MLTQIIAKHKTQQVFHTHVSMGSIKGKYQFNRTDLEEFWKVYSMTFTSEKSVPIGIAEKPQHYLPVLGDIDIKIRETESISRSELHTERHVKEVIEVYQSVLKDIVEDCTDQQLTCVLLEKPLYRVSNNNVTYAKHGFHIHFPYCFLNKVDQEIHLIPRVQDSLKNRKTFSDIGFEDSGALIDKSCCKVPWLLYGSSKDQGMDPYLVSKVFNSKGNEIDLEQAFKKYPLFDMQEKLIKITGKVEEYLPRILSIIPYGREVSEVKHGLINPIKDKVEVKIQYEKDDTRQFDPVTIDEIKSLVNMLSSQRADEYLPWLQVGWCLHSITEGSDEGLEIWKSFSSKSENYDEKACEHQWSKINRNEIKIGSLHYWAKTDNYDLYKKFIISSNNTEKYINESISGTHYDFAKLFMNTYGFDNIKITSDDNNITFYAWNEESKLWESHSKAKLTKLISDVLCPIINKKGIELLNLLANCEDKGEEAMYNAKLKQCQKSISNIKSAPYLSNIVKMIAGYEYDKDFESKVINKSIYELPIKNGRIINLQTLEIRLRNRNDFFSFELDVDFLGEDHDFSSYVLPFFNSITSNSPKLLDYHRRMWGYMMTGSITDRSLHIFWGNGCNGKSSVVNIFKNIMKEYAVNLDEDTMMKKSSGGAKPEMMDLLHSRCGILPESEQEEKINSKRVKTITGDDDISARHLFGHIVKFRTQCKPIFPTNFKPEINISDQAILDRLKLVPFLGRFEKNKKNSDYIKDLQENRLDDFFTWFCLGAKDWINGSELIPCDEMNSQMDNYIKENNPIIEFLEDTFDLISKEDYDSLDTVDKSLWRYKKTDLFIEYNCWRQVNDKRPMKKIEFNKLIESKVSEIKVKGERFYLLKIKHTDNRFDDSPNLPL
jgi:P4 family phage/plasmid primase-like protien